VAGAGGAGGWDLGKCYEVIQVAMGWEDAHLHEFAAGELRWGQPDPLGWGDTDEARREVTARLHEVLAGEGACPPEDCGGPLGYEELLAVMADPGHPEHADRLEWAGGALDPTRFDVASVASRLGAMSL